MYIPIKVMIVSWYHRYFSIAGTAGQEFDSCGYKGDIKRGRLFWFCFSTDCETDKKIGSVANVGSEIY